MIKKISFEDKILVAGAKGMAGSSICRELSKRGFSNKNTSKNILFTPTRNELNYLKNQDVENWFKKHKPSVVVIAAAKVGGINANMSQPYDFLIENLKIQNNLIENSFKFGVRRLLFLGSSCIYPKSANQPIKEEYLLSNYLEKTNEAYAVAKIAGIKLCETLRYQKGFDAICLMPTNLYGTGDNYHRTNSHVLPALIRRFHEAKINKKNLVTCWGTGNPYREFMHSDDLGSACVYALDNWDPEDINAPKDINGNRLCYLNVGTGKDIQIKELALKIANLLGYQGQIKWDTTKPDGTYKKLLDVSRINSIGWQASVSLTQGLKKTIHDFIVVGKKNRL